LIEILVALFIFSLLSVMMANGLHRLLRIQSGVAIKSSQLRELQMALLYLNRDASLIVYRPVTLSHGQEGLAFAGHKTYFELTRLGAADEGVMKSNLERVEYHIENHQFMRWVWPVVDPAENSELAKRVLLQAVNEVHFEYIDKHGKSHQGWPLQADITQPLPKAFQVIFDFGAEGHLTQTYLLSANNTGMELSHAN
jgi:general secretion pathway protein J